MRIYEIVNKTSSLVYHWTTLPKAMTALRTNKLQARRWQHYLEHEQRMARGTSWASDQFQWARENPVCFVSDLSKISNRVHSINGNRTFWLTKGMIDKNSDPDAYKHESTEPDEEFIEGTIQPLSDALVEIRVRHLSSDDFSKMNQLSKVTGVPLHIIP